MDNVQNVSTDTEMSPSILVVDDEQNFGALLETVLTDRGYEVQTAMNGEAALKLAGQGAFDLALLDIRMGQTNGLSLLSELKQRLPKVKVIMITAYPTPDSYRQSFQKGHQPFLPSPSISKSCYKPFADCCLSLVGRAKAKRRQLKVENRDASHCRWRRDAPFRDPKLEILWDIL